MNVNKSFCMSSYLTFRYVYDSDQCFSKSRRCNITDISFPRTPVKTGDELLKALQEKVRNACADGKAALALSGGIDSAILARMVPPGTKAYTFRYVVPGKEVFDESAQAAYWAAANGLEHEVLEISWEKVEEASKELMKHKGAPIHSIETQIYCAARRAKEAGLERLIFGENADIIYGGMNGLLAKDWLFSEFVDRYTYIMPYKILKKPELLLEPFIEFEKDGHIDGYDFTNKYFRQEALGTYNNACETARIQFVGPYSETVLDTPIDYERIRGGESKYLVREVFKKLYPGEEMPQKIPMPRPMNEWMANWAGPTRPEFWPHCTDHMTGDQKWMVWALERYLNMLDEQPEDENG